MVRETSIASILGIAVGLPISYGICYFTIELIEFGHMYNVKWYTYLIAVFLPLTINVIVNEFLYGKIGKISIEEASAIKR
mgnify:FL=1